MAEAYVFHCPNDDCDYFALIGYVQPTRIDPGYLDGDPPEECPQCGTWMADESGEADDPRNYIDPDAYFERETNR